MFRESKNLNMKGAWSYPPKVSRILPQWKTGYWKNKRGIVTAATNAKEFEDRELWRAYISRDERGVITNISDWFTKPKLSSVIPVTLTREETYANWRLPCTTIPFSGTLQCPDKLVSTGSLAKNIFVDNPPPPVEVMTQRSGYLIPGNVQMSGKPKDTTAIELRTEFSQAPTF